MNFYVEVFKSKAPTGQTHTERQMRSNAIPHRIRTGGKCFLDPDNAVQSFEVSLSKTNRPQNLIGCLLFV